MGVKAAERPPNMEELKGLKEQPLPSHHPSKIKNEVFISSSAVEKSQVKFLRAAQRCFEAKRQLQCSRQKSLKKSRRDVSSSKMKKSFSEVLRSFSDSKKEKKKEIC